MLKERKVHECIRTNIMPKPWLNFRPEVRWDSATRSVFGPETETSRKGDQWTVAFDVLFKF